MVTVNYIRTLNIDEPLARIKSDGTIRYYHADALGSIVALTDETGTVRTQYNYSPFGETELIGEPSDNPFQYTGRENDDTGLYYYRARYYSPRLKRFVSEDPIGLLGGDVNYYVYVWNSPLKYTDPEGLSTFYCKKTPDGHLECGFTKDPPVPEWLKDAMCVSTSVICPAASKAAGPGWGTVIGIACTIIDYTVCVDVLDPELPYHDDMGC